MEQQKKTAKPISSFLIRRLHVLYRQAGIDNDTRRAMLLNLTDGRTCTTKELTYNEAMYLSGYLNGARHEGRDLTPGERELKARRSAVLHRLQKIGVDTTNWGAINAYVSSPRIAGKVFYHLDADELAALVPKLEAIIKKG